MRYKKPKVFSQTENTVTTATALKNFLKIKARPNKNVSKNYGSSKHILFASERKYNSGMKKILFRVEDQTLLSVARRFKVPPTAIIKDNNLKADISAGDLLVIESAAGKLYAVQPTDSVESISERFGISEREIKEKNGIDYVFYGLTIVL